ncbi:MAG: hypothetical protein UT28_C0001G0210 [Berkelbacteria bacterium GW2011_GWE1_39_12]|uniref:Uncharacterized protein n=1 Tax=Berkelbacteria bacterium GW2011_GWE1_39_12 TaxID=1618337 RepID=A0A0G4B246_9BACT|nr:MAG: hypothetical protein UT28_C0001G0210 [Berkelbacteria bacterium GW2011_GWE1_39_12]
MEEPKKVETEDQPEKGESPEIPMMARVIANFSGTTDVEHIINPTYD